MTEVSVGIVVANLPPLRKSFDRIFRRVLPVEALSNPFSKGGSSGPNQNWPELPMYQMNRIQRGTREPTEDDESDKAILALAHDNRGMISKTTDIVVVQQPRGKEGW
jgi:hypothetical protein